jgi:hypothetical protein
MATYIADLADEVLLAYRRTYDGFSLPLIGAGRLAGEFPDGITTVEGVPVAAEVRVLLRRPSGAPGDGAVVAAVRSAPDGSWEVTGLPMGLAFDVVGRRAGFNDVIVAGVYPVQA